MKRLFVTCAAAALLACVPATTGASERGSEKSEPSKPTKAQTKRAQRNCRTERKRIGAKKFATRYGGSRKAQKNCVRKRLGQPTEADTGYAKEPIYTKAATQCQEEQSQGGRSGFSRKYPANSPGDSFGYCVREKTKGTGFDPEKSCQAERKKNSKAFDDKYASDESRDQSYTMRRCVSQKGGRNSTDAHKEALAQCQTEQRQDPAKFQSTYGEPPPEEGEESTDTPESQLERCTDEKAAATEREDTTEEESSERPERTPQPSTPEETESE